MPSHEYTPQQALEVLLGRVNETHPELASQVRNAIAQGKEIEVGSKSQSSRKAKKTRSHREKVRFSQEEALMVALQVLRAHYIEIPLFTNVANIEFSTFRSLNRTTEIQIEQVPETAFNLEGEPEVVTPTLVDEYEIKEREAQLERLENLFRFQQKGE